jgi:hypothetical protein
MRTSVRYHPPIENDDGEMIGRDPVGEDIGDLYEEWSFSFRPMVDGYYVLRCDLKGSTEQNSFYEEQIVISGDGFTILGRDPDNKRDVGRYTWSFRWVA